MNPSWNEKLPENELHERMLRGRKVIAELQTVLTKTYARMSVSAIADELGWSRDKVIWAQATLLMDNGDRKVRRDHKKPAEHGELHAYASKKVNGHG
jgi:hypothetical protein